MLKVCFLQFNFLPLLNVVVNKTKCLCTFRVLSCCYLGSCCFRLKLYVCNFKVLSRCAKVLLNFYLRTGFCFAWKRPVFNLVLAWLAATWTAHQLSLVTKLETFVCCFCWFCILTWYPVWRPLTWSMISSPVYFDFLVWGRIGRDSFAQLLNLC